MSLKQYNYRACKWTFEDLFDSSEWSKFSAAWRARHEPTSVGIWSPGGSLNGHLVAACITNSVPEHEALEIVYLFVHANYQGRGVGSKVLAQVCDLARQLHFKRVILVPADGLAAYYSTRGFSPWPGSVKYLSMDLAAP